MVTTLIVIVVVLLVAAGGIGYLIERARQKDFTPAAHRVIELRPLPDERLRAYRADWVAAQARFVDDPDGAVREADTLVERLMAERGYPPDSDDTTELSPDQTEVLQHYRAAHEVAESAGAPDADPDVLRRAMVHYRMVFSGLLERAASPSPR